VLNLKRKTDYAFVALARLAQQRADAPQEPISARQIADEFEMPLQQLMGILKDLQRGGIVTSTRGSHGGYHLPHDPAEVSLPRVIEAVEGPVKIASCCEEDETDACLACDLVPKCPITSKIRDINAKVYDFLEQFTLADLLADSSEPVELLIAGGAGRAGEDRRID
jgi:Rrf2 family protein